MNEFVLLKNARFQTFNRKPLFEASYYPTNFQFDIEIIAASHDSLCDSWRSYLD